MIRQKRQIGDSHGDHMPFFFFLFLQFGMFINGMAWVCYAYMLVQTYIYARLLKIHKFICQKKKNLWFRICWPMYYTVSYVFLLDDVRVKKKNIQKNAFPPIFVFHAQSNSVVLMLFSKKMYDHCMNWQIARLYAPQQHVCISPINLFFQARYTYCSVLHIILCTHATQFFFSIYLCNPRRS